MESYFLIYTSENSNFKVYLNISNSEVSKKFSELSRKPKLMNKFLLIIKAVESNEHNRTQFNHEDECDYGRIFAIKINEHRLYTIVHNDKGIRNLYISRYGRKQSQKNDKNIKSIIDSIRKIIIHKPMEC